jgi:peptide/nickel transport system permease protein
MLDVFGEDFIRTARSKGMSERRVIFRHNLRASLTPVVTQFGLDVGVLIGGAIITETVFSLPGLGYTAVTAILQQDLPVVIGVVIVASAGVIVATMLVDFSTPCWTRGFACISRAGRLEDGHGGRRGRSGRRVGRPRG